MIKDFIKDSVKYLPAHIVPGIVGFITIPIVTRLFTPHEYGNYSLVMATVGILTVALGWLPMGIIRFYPSYERDDKLAVFFGNIIKLTFISLLIVVVICCILLFSVKTRISSELYLLMYVGITVFILISIFEVLRCLLISKRQIIWYSGFAVWKSIAGFGLGLALVVFFELRIEGLFWGIILCLMMSLPLLWKVAIEGITSLRFKIDPSLLREMAIYSFPLVVGNIAGWILSLSDRYVLEFYRGSQEVGIYSASYNISERTIMLLISLFMLASSPIQMNIWEKEGERKSKEFVSKLTRYYLMICIPLFVGISVLSKPIMSILTGEDYYNGYKMIPFVAAGIFLYGLQQRFQVGFLFYKRTGFITLAVAVAGLTNLVLNIAFIPLYGYMAAAVTTLVSYIILLILMIILSKKIFVWDFPFSSLVRISCFSVIMGIFVYYLCGNSPSQSLIQLMLGISLGILLYIIMLFLFQEIQPNEKTAVKQLLATHLPCKVVPRNWKD